MLKLQIEEKQKEIEVIGDATKVTAMQMLTETLDTKDNQQQNSKCKSNSPKKQSFKKLNQDFGFGAVTNFPTTMAEPSPLLNPTDQIQFGAKQKDKQLPI